MNLTFSVHCSVVVRVPFVVVVYRLTKFVFLVYFCNQLIHVLPYFSETVVLAVSLHPFVVRVLHIFIVVLS